MDETWATIVRNMRPRSPSLQALLRSGYLLRAAEGELTIGFLHDFHRNQFTDVKKRRLLEEVVGETLGTAYRVNCIKVSKEEVEAARGESLVDDGFIDEVADRLRAYHVRQLGNGHS
jgi:DNA polymerase-3 subunit gamma/tau